ncbi:hypothetical protein D3C71_1727730 [compost metagenome]
MICKSAHTHILKKTDRLRFDFFGDALIETEIRISARSHYFPDRIAKRQLLHQRRSDIADLLADLAQIDLAVGVAQYLHGSAAGE